MRLLISLILLFSFSPYVGALTSLDRAEFSFPNSLQDSNPGFESGTVKWTGSGGTFTINSTPADQFVAGSKQFAVWDSDGAAQERCSALVKVPESGNCAVSLTYKVPSGTATHKIVAKDGSKDLAVEDVFSSTAAWRHDVEFPCAAAASNQARVCLRSVASNEPAIQLDGGYAGEARNVGVADLIGERIAYSPTFNSTTGHSASNGWYYRLGSYAVVGGAISFNGTGAASTFTFSMPPGLVIDTSRLNNSTVADLRNRVGAWSWYDDAGGLSINPQWVRPNTNTTFLFMDGSNTVISNSFANNDRVSWEIVVPIVGWAASQVVMPDAQGWFASGFISGGNPALGSTAVSSYAEIANGSLSLTANTGSASVGIACSSTNASTVGSSTCSAGNEIIGITTNIPTTGVYEACFQFGHVINIGGTAGGSLTAAFQVVETANSSGTVTQEANGRVTSGAGYEGGSNSPNQVNPVMVCGTLSLNAGQRLIKVYYEQATPSGTIFTNEIQADASAAVGQRNIYFIVRPVNSQQRTILANSVTTKRQSGDRILSGTFNCDASSTVTRTNEPDSTSIGNIASGACAVTYAPFSAAPDACTPVIQTCSASSGTGCFARASTAATASGVSVQCYSDTGTLCTSHDFYMICTGPR